MVLNRFADLATCDFGQGEWMHFSDDQIYDTISKLMTFAKQKRVLKLLIPYTAYNFKTTYLSLLGCNYCITHPRPHVFALEFLLHKFSVLKTNRQQTAFVPMRHR